ncbi:MAG: hypothetical protein CO162_02550 [bacterium (Candidatus Ratteibacteria) CG_4_9_14_3_um_filter_41_21]|uniref:Cobalt ABC transporter permease n=2 Tax=Candidatus Ratteibacteria TaxID=2979319 RepID=A0A2M7YGQ8_9BACT|nr:MAG: hypothetical protein COW28_00435 [bacterium (Candidatus Ratteibacteria) CG15_BIG_FIL_POST_REV_8_21_14_020_41_12]PJA62162.1 MAG: hypothetical protein CO162_02550 [bacterium (Candidatus Ratteibacteria) CG_4_9_14_3_um_filter_41_21]
MKKKFLKFSIYFILLCLFVIMTGSNIFAHKVIIFAYLAGDTVYTESYFSDGKKVKDGEIIVYDSQGNKLLEGKTDKDGLFNFKLPKKDDLKIILNATMGHKNSYILSASEIPDIPEKSSYIPTYLPPSRGRIEEGGKALGKEVAEVNLDQIKSIIENSLDEKLKPMMRQLKKAEQKKLSFTEVIGGIGYIFGIMGIIMYFLSRKKEG